MRVYVDLVFIRTHVEYETAITRAYRFIAERREMNAALVAILEGCCYLLFGFE